MHITSVHRNLKLLWWLRCIAIGGQVAAILVVTYGLHIELDTTPLWSIIAAEAGLNAATWWRIRVARRIGHTEFFCQLLADNAALFGLLYFSGGAANPFAPLFILQVIIAAITLEARYTWCAAAVSIAFYTALMVWKVEVPMFEHHHMGDFFNLHVLGMWISFMLLAGIIGWFVVRMNGTIRRQNLLLAEAEKIAAIGTLAANAAHELGTPLATLFVLAEDLPEKQPFLEQLQRCKHILSRITAAGGVIRAESGTAVGADQFLGQLVADWMAAHPAVTLTTWLQTGTAPRIIGEMGLAQAIRNLLDNAADASPVVQLQATWNIQALSIVITDEGVGIPDPMPEPGVTTKPGGMGMGLFLARSVIARLEGTLTLQAAARGGTVATIALPLRRIAL